MNDGMQPKFYDGIMSFLCDWWWLLLALIVIAVVLYFTRNMWLGFFL